MAAVCLALAFASANTPQFRMMIWTPDVALKVGHEQSISNLSLNIIVVHRPSVFRG
jgi:hypothetical protein